MKIDGGLEARHFLGDSDAIGLVTRLGPVDLVLEPRGFEAGYTALIAGSNTVRRGDVEIRVGGLADLIRSKELLRRAKDVQHLAVLYERFPELAIDSQPSLPTPKDACRVQDPARILVTDPWLGAELADMRRICLPTRCAESWPGGRSDQGRREVSQEPKAGD